MYLIGYVFRNRPGDPMRDKYNLNTLPPGVEEDSGNLGDLHDKKPGMLIVFHARDSLFILVQL